MVTHDKFKGGGMPGQDIDSPPGFVTGSAYRCHGVIDRRELAGRTKGDVSYLAHSSKVPPEMETKSPRRRFRPNMGSFGHTWGRGASWRCRPVSVDLF